MIEERENHEETEYMPFNMAALIYMELHDLRQSKSRAMIDSQLDAAYDCLWEIYITAQIKFRTPERSSVEELLFSADTLLKNRQIQDLPPQQQRMQMYNIKKKLRQIDMAIINLMHMHKMIFPKLQTGDLSSIMKRYDLPIKSTDKVAKL